MVKAEEEKAVHSAIESDEIEKNGHLKKIRLREFYEKIKRKTERAFCKNAIVGIKQTKNDTKKHIYDFKITSEGCEKQRRHGSKWCQECSDKHNNQ